MFVMGIDVTNNYKERNSLAFVKMVASFTGLVGMGVVSFSAYALGAGGIAIFPIIGIVIGLALVIFSIAMARRISQKEQELAKREVIPLRLLEKKGVQKKVCFCGVEAQRKKDPLREKMHEELKRKVQEREQKKKELLSGVEERREQLCGWKYVSAIAAALLAAC